VHQGINALEASGMAASQSGRAAELAKNLNKQDFLFSVAPMMDWTN
jgi:hypothetical protein